MSKVNGNRHKDISLGSQQGKRRKKPAAQFKGIALTNKDEWLTYLQKNIKNIDQDLGGSQWPKHLLQYIKTQ